LRNFRVATPFWFGKMNASECSFYRQAHGRVPNRERPNVRES